ncbi:hypothetical protein ACFQGS_04300 [Novosphingobium lubricantis]
MFGPAIFRSLPGSVAMPRDCDNKQQNYPSPMDSVRKIAIDAIFRMSQQAPEKWINKRHGNLGRD